MGTKISGEARNRHPQNPINSNQLMDVVELTYPKSEFIGAVSASSKGQVATARLELPVREGRGGEGCVPYLEGHAPRLLCAVCVQCPPMSPG
jgi:hypothetical protein